MKTTSLKCEIITPMFAGSAIPGKCELRPPAIKGALRYWWRALNAHKGEAEMRKAEARIFGTSDETFGQSKIQIVVKHTLRGALPDFRGKGKEFSVTSKGKTFSVSILDYLAYGCHERGHGVRYHRPCFNSGDQFELCFSWHGDEAEAALFQALNALAKFGGLGGRSRNGWGSIAIAGLREGGPIDLQSREAPEFNGFWKDSKLFLSKDLRPRWDMALADVGIIYHDARQSLERKHFYSRRVMVAQPIIVQKEEVTTMFLDRHAKSLFLSVAKVGNQYRGQILWMPIDFPKGIQHSSLARKPTPKEIPLIQSAYASVHKDLLASISTRMTLSAL